MCTPVRVDAKNENTSWTQNLGALQEDDTNAYVFWCGVDAILQPNTSHNAEIRVRPINKTTLTMGAVQLIDADDVAGADDPWDWDGVAVCRLDSGIMIAVYGTSYLGVGESIHGKESAANDYTTWGARQAFTPSGQGRCIGGLVTDGTEVWLLSQDNNTADLYIHERTGVNTWALATTALGSGKIFDSVGFSSTAPYFFVSTASGGTSLSSMRYGARQGDVGCFVLPYAQTTTDADAIACLRTEDNWATTEPVVLIKDYAGSADSIAAGTAPKLVLGSDGRLRAMWIEDNDALGKFVPVLAYSDDMGATWTVIGTPTPFTAFDWDNTWDGALCLNPENGMLVSGLDDTDANNLKHHLFRGTDSLLGWEDTICEGLDGAVISAFAGGSHADCFLDSNGDFIRVFNGVTGVGPSYNTVNYLIEEGTRGGGGDEPEQTIESVVSGAEENNLYYRIDFYEGKGWSLHHHAGGCAMSWDEGDKETGREVPIVVTGSPSIDPTIQDVTILPAIWRIEDPESFGKRVYLTDGETVEVRQDPLKFRIQTKDWQVAELFERNVMRGVLVTWSRDGDPVTLEVWVDDDICRVIQLPNTNRRQTTRFYALPPWVNVGEKIRMVVEDETVDFLAIDALGFKYIDKRVRG